MVSEHIQSGQAHVDTVKAVEVLSGAARAQGVLCGTRAYEALVYH